MDIQAISAAATVAIACAIVFLLAARTWQALSRSLTAQSRFADSIMSEAAQRFRDELSDLSRVQSAYLGAGVVFVVMYSVWAVFRGPDIFAGYPSWQLYVVLASLVAAAAFAAWRVFRNVLALGNVRYRRDAVIAVGHELQRIGPDNGRAYHDVPTAGGTIDHVLVGRHGVYAINVVARRQVKGGRAGIHRGRLAFSGDDQGVNVTDFIKSTRQLEKQLGRQSGRVIKVRSVIAVPGWEVEQQEDADHLLVNERTIPMIRGWRDHSESLMNEEVEELQAYLTERCKLSRR